VISLHKKEKGQEKEETGQGGWSKQEQNVELTRRLSPCTLAFHTVQ